MRASDVNNLHDNLTLRLQTGLLVGNTRRRCSKMAHSLMFLGQDDKRLKTPYG